MGRSWLIAMQISEKCAIRETEMARIASAIEKAASAGCD